MCQRNPWEISVTSFFSAFHGVFWQKNVWLSRNPWEISDQWSEISGPLFSQWFIDSLYNINDKLWCLIFDIYFKKYTFLEFMFIYLFLHSLSWPNAQNTGTYSMSIFAFALFSLLGFSGLVQLSLPPLPVW